MPETRRCLVAVCCNQPTIYAKTAQSLMELGWGDRIPVARERHGFANIGFAWYTGAPRVDQLRNQAVVDALKGRPWGPDDTEPAPYTHVLFLDADMVWPTTVITDMLRHHDRGIVAGLYVLKGPPYSPVHLLDQHDVDGVNMFHRATDYGTELVPVDVVGMGCTLIPVAAFRQTGDRNWFDYAPDAQGWPRVSEDVTFCLKAKAAGIPRYMDPTVRCGHVTAQVIDHRWDQRYQASIAASATMGPTVSIHAPESPVGVG